MFLCPVTGLSLSENGRKVKNPMDATIINKRRFGDDGNRSFIPVAVRLHGDAVWPLDMTELGKNLRGEPRHLALSDNCLIVDYGAKLQALDKNTGKELWQRSKFDNAEFDLNEKGMITVSAAGTYEGVDLKGSVYESRDLPSCVDNARLLFLSRGENDLFYVVNYYGSRSRVSGQNSATVDFSIVRKDVKDPEKAWSWVKYGELAKWVCRSFDGSTFTIASDHALYRLPVKVERDDQVAAVQFARIEALSLLRDNTALVVEKSEQGRFLHVLEPGGATTSRLALEQNGELVQPPASSPDKDLYIPIGSTLYCFKEYKEAWRMQFESAREPILCTVLSDKSALCASGHYLFQVSADGKLAAEKFVVPEITCRPIADQSGNVYAAGRGGIVCLH
jgi:hypothetical protein